MHIAGVGIGLGWNVQAARCLAELSVPHYHHEFVKRALVSAFENPKAAPSFLALLAHLGDSNQITQVGRNFDLQVGGTSIL